MDPVTEFVLLMTLVVGVPAVGLRWFCRALTREIGSWAPERRPPRYQLVQVIPQVNRLPR